MHYISMKTLLIALLLFPFLSLSSQLCKDSFLTKIPRKYAISKGNLKHYLKSPPRMDLEKMAMMSFYLPNEGVVADMGSGTGKATHFIAHSYPHTKVIGVDIDPKMVENASSKYEADNLSYKQGDISKKIFPDNSLDAIINSSVIHHVTSFSGEGYSLLEGIKAFFNQIEQLKNGGIFMLRDFVIPKGSLTAQLKLRNDDGKGNQKLTELSTFQIFKLFAKEFRSSIHKDSIPYKIIQKNKKWSTIELDLRTIVEFLHHKDYLSNWKAEIKEEYLYMSQNQIEEIYRMNQMRILVSRPIYNEWIYKNRFEDKIKLQDTNGNPIPYPPTKILTIGEKVNEDEGVKIYEKRSLSKDSSYLKIKYMQNKDTKEVLQIIERPFPVIDVIPYFKNENKLYIVSRKGYPRGIINANLETPHLRDVYSGGYVNEPLVTTTNQSEIASLKKLIVEKYKLIKKIDLNDIHVENSYYSSEGLIAEKISPYFVNIGQKYNNISGHLTYTEAGHALRAFQVGGAFDSRLEINIYRLLKYNNLSFEEWIGDTISLKEIPLPKLSNVFSFEGMKKKQSWVSTKQKVDYADVKVGEFLEINSRGFTVNTYPLEYVLPKHVSHHTVSFIPVFKSNGEIYVGLEVRDLPIPQIFNKNSILPTVPAYRIPKDKSTMTLAREYSTHQLEKDFKVKINNISPLGSDYRVSMGITPEIVYPFVVEVNPLKNNRLHWISLKQLLDNEDKIQSAHLLTSLFRLYHSFL